MYLRKSSITTDILDVLSDGQIHTMQNIADKVEVSRKTVCRHIQSLSCRYPIKTFCGGNLKGGVQLIEPKVSVEELNFDELQLIIKHLELLQTPNVKIKLFIKNLRSQLKIKEHIINGNQIF